MPSLASVENNKTPPGTCRAEPLCRAWSAFAQPSSVVYAAMSQRRFSLLFLPCRRSPGSRASSTARPPSASDSRLGWTPLTSRAGSSHLVRLRHRVAPEGTLAHAQITIGTSGPACAGSVARSHLRNTALQAIKHAFRYLTEMVVQSVVFSIVDAIEASGQEKSFVSFIQVALPKVYLECPLHSKSATWYCPATSRQYAPRGQTGASITRMYTSSCGSPWRCGRCLQSTGLRLPACRFRQRLRSHTGAVCPVRPRRTAGIRLR